MATGSWWPMRISMKVRNTMPSTTGTATARRSARNRAISTPLLLPVALLLADQLLPHQPVVRPPEVAVHARGEYLVGARQEGLDERGVVRLLLLRVGDDLAPLGVVALADRLVDQLVELGIAVRVDVRPALAVRGEEHGVRRVGHEARGEVREERDRPR